MTAHEVTLGAFAEEAIAAAATAPASGAPLGDIFAARAADVKRVALAAQETRLARRVRDAALWAALAAGVVFCVLLLVKPGFIYAQDDDFSSPQVSLLRTALLAGATGLCACAATCYLAP